MSQLPIKVVFLRDANNKPNEPAVSRRPAVYVEPDWQEIGSVMMHPSLLPNKGDYVHVPLTKETTIGTVVLDVARHYAHHDDVHLQVKMEKVEVKVA